LQEVNRGDVSIPQPVIAEISFGIQRLPRSKRRELLQNRFDIIRLELGRVNWADPVSERFGSIKAVFEKRGKRIEDFDAAIAAHALAEDAVLVRANLEQITRVSGPRLRIGPGRRDNFDFSRH
jgi:predicted nucleic acid-binding protein